MNKDRLGSFMDAVIAIVMTILVLELEKPAEPTLEAFWALRISFAAYGVSFLWLSAMWISLHNAWYVAGKISVRTIRLSMVLLFFSSLYPYATSLVGTYGDSKVEEGFYGIVVIATTVMMVLIYKSLAKDDPQEEIIQYMNHACRLLEVDIGIKIVGLVLGLLFWPRFVALGILIAAIFTGIVKRENLVSKHRQ